MNKKDIHVVIGLSGGVDSAVSLYLLKEAGYKVTALFMRNWDSEINFEQRPNKLSDEQCEQEADFQDAKAVANLLDVSIKRVDFIQEYWDLVFSKSIEGFKRGITPNPDMLCNKYIKFDMMLKYAKEKLKADKIAMGHYAKVIEKDGEYLLSKAKDNSKDQTYFLSFTKKKVWKDVIFPLADLLKTEVREIAKKINLPNATKKDSTGICFIGERKFAQFLQNYIEVKTGNIIDIETNKVIGTHDGISFYTIGQRKGLNLGGQEDAKYVCKKDYDKNIIYVANVKNDKYLWTQNLKAIEFNNMANVPFNKEIKVEIKIRHSTISHKAILTLNKDNSIKVMFNEKQRAITPGQWCVAYKKDICLGSAIII